MNDCCVYIMKSKTNEIIYVGISVNPKARLTSHISNKSWIKEVSRIDFEWLPTVEDAKDRESKIISTYQPKYNIRLTERSDNKSRGKALSSQAKTEIAKEMIRVIKDNGGMKCVAKEISQLAGKEILRESISYYIIKGDLCNRVTKTGACIALYFYKKSAKIKLIRPDVEKMEGLINE